MQVVFYAEWLYLRSHNNLLMLAELSIKNYALIDDLNVTFSRGFTTITGETGAGKSILLGGLSLVLGKRADLSSLRDKERKCVIEAQFEIENYDLQIFFNANELDYESLTIVRREILPSGKSRAFINDTPVTLDILSQLGNRLVDVHSQHQTLQLTDHDFQLKVVDALSENRNILDEYKTELEKYRITERELQILVANQANAIKDHDYNSFLLNELEGATLIEGIQQELEDKYEKLNNVETILELLSKGHQIVNDEQAGALALLFELRQISNKLATFGSSYTEFNDRVQSLFIELDDITTDLGSLESGVEANPELLDEVNTKLQAIYDLQKKHGVSTIEALIEIKDELTKKVDQTSDLDSAISTKEQLLAELDTSLRSKAETLHLRRKTVIPILKERLEDALLPLGMPNASFRIELQQASNFKINGLDDLLFQFAANKGTEHGDLKKVASGGELSRIMLTIKSILSHYEKLPTMMFDEIDTGVSGEVSNRMGDIMQKMSENMQIFAITHLPQVASKGDQHFKVYKEDVGGITQTKMKVLSTDERVVELAEMLGGKSLSDSALAHARQLLN